MTAVERIRQAVREAEKGGWLPVAVNADGATYDAYSDHVEQVSRFKAPSASHARAHKESALLHYCGVLVVKDDALAADSVVVVRL